MYPRTLVLGRQMESRSSPEGTAENLRDSLFGPFPCAPRKWPAWATTCRALPVQSVDYGFGCWAPAPGGEDEEYSFDTDCWGYLMRCFGCGLRSNKLARDRVGEGCAVGAGAATAPRRRRDH